VCGERERVYGVACPGCGTQPEVHEVNPPVQKRRRIVEQLRSVGPAALSVPTDSGAELFQELLGDLASWMGDFWAALAEEERSVGRAGELTALLLGRVKVIMEFPRLRPWRGLCQGIEDCLVSLRGVWEATLDAFAAPTSQAGTARSACPAGTYRRGEFGHRPVEHRGRPAGAHGGPGT
jgi:hypothetical protein